jgi:hypothetical protein
MFPHVADDVIRHRRFNASGEISRQPGPPARRRREKAPIDRDGQVILSDNSSNMAESVLPALSESNGIKRRDKKFDPRGSQINASPVKRSSPFGTLLDGITAKNNAFEDLSGGSCLVAVRGHESELKSKSQTCEERNHRRPR